MCTTTHWTGELTIAWADFLFALPIELLSKAPLGPIVQLSLQKVCSWFVILITIMYLLCVPRSIVCSMLHGRLPFRCAPTTTQFICSMWAQGMVSALLNKSVPLIYHLYSSIVDVWESKRNIKLLFPAFIRQSSLHVLTTQGNILYAEDSIK